MSGDTELDQLRAEVAELRAQVGSERQARSARARSTISWILTVLAAIATVLALLGVWTLRTMTETDLFVDRVGSIIEQPEVAAAVGDAAAGELVEALELEDRLRDQLPDDLGIAAGPITTAAENYLAQGATALIQTDQFQAAWDAALAAGHSVSIAVLSGQDRGAVQNEDGVIVVNLTPVVNALVAEGSGFLSDLLGREIAAPTLTGDDIEAAVGALEEQLGVDLPSDFGEVVLFESDDLAAAQAAFDSARAAVWLAPIVALVLIGLAIAVSTRRARTSLAIVVITAVLLLVVAVLLQPVESAVVSSVADVGLQDAVAAGIGTVLGSLRTGIVLVVLLGVLAAGGLVLTGSGETAQRSRDIAGQAPSLAARHRGWALVAGALVALIVLAVLPGRSWGQVLIVLLLYAAYALVVVALRGPGAADSETAGEPSAGGSAAVED